jgi:hypothetical protein
MAAPPPDPRFASAQTTSGVSPPQPGCPFCGGPHGYMACTRVKAIEWHDGPIAGMWGSPKRVEFVTPSDWLPSATGPLRNPEKWPP